MIVSPVILEMLIIFYRQQSKLGDHYIIRPYEQDSIQERLILPLPMFHIFGIHVAMMYGLFQGAQLIILPNFGHKLVLKCIREYKVFKKICSKIPFN